MSQYFDPESQLVIFTHIPKCGGTSVHSCLSQMMPGKYGLVSPANPLDGFENDIYGLGGHFSFNGVPNRILRGRQPVYMTILRHPIERVISFMKHVAARPYHYGHVAVEDFHSKSPLEILTEWEKLGFAEIENLMTQMLSNRSKESATAKLALHNVEEHYRFVATVDGVDRLVRDLAEFLRVPEPKIERLNQTIVAGREGLRSKEFLDKVISLNEKDLIVYRRIKERFNTEIEPESDGF